ncbi:hypothetical protein [Nevskia ramosa]|uniref:hypothetical protein n=1 Tax=Nevskia ramosa TaxID=64002 RepID=UPI003D095F65
MSQVLHRSDVATVLREWAAGVLSSEQVFKWANAHFAIEAWDAEDGAVNEVMAQLDTMDMNLVTSEDAPILLAALEAKTAEGAAEVIGSHNAVIDWSARKQRLSSEPLYSPFCK